MPLVSARDFPGIFAQPDKSGIARGLQQAFTDQRQQQETQRVEQIQVAKDKIEQFGFQAQTALGMDNIDRKKKFLAQMGQRIQREGGDLSEVNRLMAIENVDELNLALTQIATAAADGGKRLDESLKPARAKAGLASAKTEILEDGTVIQALPDGTVDVRDASGALVTGEKRLDAIKASQKFREERLRTESEIAVGQARKIAGAKARQTRISGITKEFSDSSRLAARSDIRLRQAEILANQAAQGLSGEIKVKLAKLFPDIDVSDEGALMASLQSLALDELQKFKGPTTDFEFGVAQSISGALGNPKTANLARIKSLQRNNWFVKREGEQFRRHVKSGGDPDNFTFNFGEPVKTKKGVFTLQQLQDTAVQNNISIDDVLEKLNK